MAYWADIWRDGMSQCLSVYSLVNSDVYVCCTSMCPSYICMSIITFIHLSSTCVHPLLYSYICQYICTSIGMFICASVLH